MTSATDGALYIDHLSEEVDVPIKGMYMHIINYLFKW